MDGVGGYLKVEASRKTKSRKSRSIDFSDFVSSYASPKPITQVLVPEDPSKAQEINAQEPLPLHEREEEEEEGVVFGVILSRSWSVSSPCKAQNPSSTLQSTLKRAFSMRRSSSVSEGYCRIHDQNKPRPIFTAIEDVGLETRSNKKRGRILKACTSPTCLHRCPPAHPPCAPALAQPSSLVSARVLASTPTCTRLLSLQQFITMSACFIIGKYC